jgi:tetratricopeptide (TPR) repeat protein
MNKVTVMSASNVREDPIKLHKQAISLMENSKFEEARDLFIKTGELYFKGQNYFGSAEMYYKAGEAAFALKDNEKAAELFMKSSEISFSKAFDRYGVSALEYARDCYTALNNQEKAEELTKKIKEVNQKLNQSSGSDEEQSFSVFS